MCGVAGAIFDARPEVLAQWLYTLSYHLQHRGYDSAGMVIERPDGTYKYHKRPGTIDRAFIGEDLSSHEWHGYAGIAHVRYSTSGVNFRDTRKVEEALRAAQPYKGIFKGGPFFMSYNGNLTPSSVASLFSELYDRVFSSSIMQRGIWVDTELIVKAIENAKEDQFIEALFNVCRRLQGAFSMIFLYEGMLYAIRDSHGFRPLEVGKCDFGYIVASEDSVFTKFPNGKKMLSIAPGECMTIRKQDHTLLPITQTWDECIYPEYSAKHNTHFCQFEQVYFSRGDSTLGGERVMVQQERLGRALARECPPPLSADIVMGVPDSGVPAAYGYALESGIRYDQRGLQRLHGVGRTFLEPVHDLRVQGVDFKLSVIPEFLSEKIIVVVDDSIVRGNVTPRVVYLLKNAGAKEVHMRISSPPTRFGCTYGIDTFRIENELIARGIDAVEDIRKKINALIRERYKTPHELDSLGYLSLEGMKSTWKGKEGLCDACWTGNYPVK